MRSPEVDLRGAARGRTSLVRRPWRNLTVSGPRKRMTERVARRHARGPTESSGGLGLGLGFWWKNREWRRERWSLGEQREKGIFWLLGFALQRIAGCSIRA